MTFSPLNVWLGEVVLGWRRALRGPMACALGVLFLGLLWCAFAIHGENRLLWHTYALGFLWALLLVAALWCGSMAYAFDRERHRLALTFAKPLRPWVLWWGRFFGTLLPFALATFVLWAFLLFIPYPPGRESLKPELPDLEQSVSQEMARLQRENRLPKNIPQARLRRAVRDEVLHRYTELQPGQPQAYTFRSPGLHQQPLTFQLSGTPFLGAKDALTLELDVACGPERQTLRPDALRDNGFSVPLPLALTAKGDTFTVALKRLDTNDAGSVLYRERVDLGVLVPKCSALVNKTCFCLVLFASLAMMVALGTALGCIFSLPSSLFIGSVTLLALTAATLSPATTVAEEQATLWGRISAPVATAIAKPFQPFVQLNPLNGLTEGLALLPCDLLRLFLVSFLPWVLLCSLIAPLSPTRDETL